MNYYIITGTSRGLGEAIALKVISKENHLFSISRKRNESLISTAEQNSCNIDYYEFDLNNLEGIDELLERILVKTQTANIKSVYLINNAGVLNPMKPAHRCKSDDIISNLKVNAVAPIAMTSGFLKLTERVECDKMVINISSGAGNKPYYGWSCYCSSKAALDMFTKCVAVEQAKNSHPVKIISFAPGIIDTGMQAEIRQSSENDFEQVERFRKFKEDNVLLASPDFVARKVLELIGDEGVKSGGIYDIKDFLHKE